MSALQLELEVAINLLLLGIGTGIGIVAAATNCGGAEMKILSPNLALPTTLTRFRMRHPNAALFGLGTTLALVKHTCLATTGLFISIIISMYLL